MLGLALLSLCALSALMTASASAVLTFELALWLLDGADVISPVLVDSLGELLLENLLNGAAIECSGLFEGFVEAESLDLVTIVYDLSGTLWEELVGSGVACSSEKLCTEGRGKAWPIKLPWETEVERDPENGLFYELTLGAEWHLECTVLGIKAEELCTLPVGSVEILNVVGGVEAMGPVEPEAECNGNPEEGLVEFLPGNLTTDVAGGTMSVSVP